MDIANQKKLGTMELTPASRHTLAEVFLLLMVIGLFFWFIVRPKMSVLSMDKTQRTKLQEEQDSLSHDVNMLQILTGQLKAKTADIAKLDEALPLQNKTVRNHLLMKVLADSAGVKIGDLNFADKGDEIIAGNKELLAHPFAASRSLKVSTGSVSVSGTYDNLQAFLQRVESNARLIDIIDMEIAGTGDGGLGMKLDLKTYSYE